MMKWRLYPDIAKLAVCFLDDLGFSLFFFFQSLSITLSFFFLQEWHILEYIEWVSGLAVDLLFSYCPMHVATFGIHEGEFGFDIVTSCNLNEKPASERCVMCGHNGTLISDEKKA